MARIKLSLTQLGQGGQDHGDALEPPRRHRPAEADAGQQAEEGAPQGAGSSRGARFSMISAAPTASVASATATVKAMNELVVVAEDRGCQRGDVPVRQAGQGSNPRRQYCVRGLAWQAEEGERCPPLARETRDTVAQRRHLVVILRPALVERHQTLEALLWRLESARRHSAITASPIHRDTGASLFAASVEVHLLHGEQDPRPARICESYHQSVHRIGHSLI